MWCKHCRQDVPGIAVAEDAGRAEGLPTRSDGAAAAVELPFADPQPATGAGRRLVSRDAATSGETAHFVCARCGEVIGTSPKIVPAEEATSREQGIQQTSGADSSSPTRFEAWQWELDQELHDVQHLLQSRAGNAERPPEHRASLYSDIDQALETESPSRITRVDLPATAPLPRATRRNSAPFFAWLVFAFGLMGLTCGGVLLGWSVVTGRSELWRVGLPIMLAGQAVLLVGLVLLLEGFWRANRSADPRRTKFEQQSVDRRAVTTPLGLSQTASGQEYYAHPAHSGHPHLVLADIKRQLDLLTDHIGSDDE